MIEPVIQCPHCHKEIKLTESLAAPLVEATRQEFEQKSQRKTPDPPRSGASCRRAVAGHGKTTSRRERQTIAQEEASRARRLVSDELEGKSRALVELNEVLKAKDEKLTAAQNAQADLIRKQRELDDAKREFELTVETRVQESLGAVRDKAKHDAEEELKLKISEREETIASMQRQIEILKQKAEQGSQQLQGEVQEMELEALLAAKFPADLVEPVPKGEFGGDILHRVLSPSGQQCGTVIWESKRTKNWSDGWLGKLKNDQRAAKAEFAVPVSRTLPKEVVAFDFVEGVWVVEPRCAVPIAIALRQSLIELASARQTSAGQRTKMGMVYEYLTGPRFRARVESIVEKFTEMEADLARERKTMTRLWAKREEQIRGVIESTAGMYSDLQGIAGKGLNEIEGLQIAMLPAGEGESTA